MIWFKSEKRKENEDQRGVELNRIVDNEFQSSKLLAFLMLASCFDGEDVLPLVSPAIDTVERLVLGGDPNQCKPCIHSHPFKPFRDGAHYSNENETTVVAGGGVSLESYLCSSNS